MCYKAVLHAPHYRGAWLAKAAGLLVLLACFAGCEDSSNNISNNTSNKSKNGSTQVSLSAPVFVDADKTETDAGAGTNHADANHADANRETSQAVVVIYDATTDRLTIRAQDAPLVKLLGKITLQTGIETWIDEGFDPEISADIEQQAPESALKQLLKDISHIMHYGRNQQGGTLITGVEVLQEGSEPGMGLSIVPIYGQSTVLARRYSSSKTLNFAQQRWEQRLAKMPEVKRRELEEHYLKTMEYRQREIAHREQIRAEQKQRREQRREQRLLERKQRDEALGIISQ